VTTRRDDVFDVFLSYAHTDAEFVEQLGARLEDETHLRVWLDKWILVPGAHWQQEMAKGLNKAKSCAVCLGSATPAGWFREEIERALNRQARENAFRVIPVILPEGSRSSVGDFLELRTWVEFQDGVDDARAFHVLVSGIRGVAPGRGPSTSGGTADERLVEVRETLIRIQVLRQEQLIDNDIAIEYQRRLLDRLVKE
jgi:TIR domain